MEIYTPTLSVFQCVATQVLNYKSYLVFYYYNCHGKVMVIEIYHFCP